MENNKLIQNELELVLSTLKTLFIDRISNFVTKQPQKVLLNGDRKWLNALSNYLPVDKIEQEEGIILALALVPHIRPHFIDQVIQEVNPEGGEFLHLGGIRGKNHRGFLPTGETALFLLSGEDLENRFKIQQMFFSEHWFAKKQVLQLAGNGNEEPAFSGQLILDQEYVEKITLGKASKPTFSSQFPAALISTQMDWEDLVLPTQTEQQIQEILIWLSHNKTLMKDLGMDRKLKPGYRALFHGPPGTGKTLTANLLGKYTSRDVYRVDLSTVVSKYIGETEKNLSNLFNRAENKDWILFFDEADALFGKRTSVQNAHDRYANQEVAYLLQRIEEYQGLVVLASNFKSNIDEAFIRRFQSIIHFSMPKSNERLRLWQKAFPDKIKLSKEVDFKHFSQQYELTGADIMNVVQYVCLSALSKNNLSISNKDIIEGIQREFIKSGKIC
jgi:hypothetical protein